jgi:Resolvase, N terminal domain
MSSLCGYLRVSHDPETEPELGPSFQQAAIQCWAQEHGHSVVLWRRDDHSGADSQETRKALSEALAAVGGRRVEGLVVYRLDRLAGDLVLQEQLLAEIRSMGAQLFTTSAIEEQHLRDDTTDPSRMLVRHVVRAVVQNEQSIIALRGGYANHAPDNGGPPVTNPAEQELLSRICELRDMCRSLREMATALTAKRIWPESPPRRTTTSLRLFANRREAS